MIKNIIDSKIDIIFIQFDIRLIFGSRYVLLSQVCRRIYLQSAIIPKRFAISNNNVKKRIWDTGKNDGQMHRRLSMRRYTILSAGIYHNCWCMLVSKEVSFCQIFDKWWRRLLRTILDKIWKNRYLHFGLS